MADSDRSALEDARKRARRRLVGAIVLVLVAAVVLPMFLETDPKPLGPDVQLQIPPIDDGKFQNRLTPEGKGGKGEIARPPSQANVSAGPGAVTAPPSPAAAPPTTAPAAIAQTATPAPASGNDAASAAASTSASATSAGASMPVTPGPTTAPAAPASAAATPPSGSATTASTSTASPPSEPAATASTPTATTASSTLNATPTANPNGKFVVQLGAFVGLAVAVELADKARDAGYPVFLQKVTTQGGPVHRVRVGPYGTQGEAQASAVKLKLAGFTSADVQKR